jgi:hypothetical protein
MRALGDSLGSVNAIFLHFLISYWLMSPSVGLTFPFVTHFIISRLFFDQKSENTNYSAVNACGLAFLSSFKLSNPTLFQRDPHMDSPVTIPVKCWNI